MPDPKPLGGSLPAERVPFDIIDEVAKPGTVEPDYVEPTDEDDDEGDDEDDAEKDDDEGGGGGEGDGGDGEGDDDAADDADDDAEDDDDDGEDDGSCSDDGDEQTEEISDIQNEVESYSASDYELDFLAWYTEYKGVITSVYGGTVQAMPPTFRKNLPNGNYEIVTVVAFLDTFEVVSPPSVSLRYGRMGRR